MLSMRVCVRVCKHACVRACVRACMRVCLYACACMFVCVYVFVYACTWCVRACMYVCVHVCVRACVCVCMYVCYLPRSLDGHKHSLTIQSSLLKITSRKIINIFKCLIGKHLVLCQWYLGMFIGNPLSNSITRVLLRSDDNTLKNNITKMINTSKQQNIFFVRRKKC